MGCWRWSSWLGRFDWASSLAGGCSQPGSNGTTAVLGFELRDVVSLCSGSVSVNELGWRLAGTWAVVRVMLTRYGATVYRRVSSCRPTPAPDHLSQLFLRLNSYIILSVSLALLIRFLIVELIH
jgi:hypothetical protein